jgi:hypothetical protein
MTDLATRRSTTELPAPTPPSKGVRLAWLIPGGLLAIATLVWGVFSVLSVLAHEEYTTSTTFASDSVTALDVRSEDGSVTVDATAAPGDPIVVTAEVSDGWQATDVTARVVDGVLRLRGECPWLSTVWCRVDFTVTIPADVPVVVAGSDGSVRVRGTTVAVAVSSDNGSIDLENISGDITVSNDNGRITGRRLDAAAVRATNQNGDIELTFATAPGSVDATTDNGRIDVVVPDSEVAYRVELSSANGSTDNAVRTDPASDRTIRLTSDNGSVSVRPSG